MHLPALWVDVDIRTEGAHAADDLPVDRDEAWQLISDFPLHPTVVIDSGNGLQLYWGARRAAPGRRGRRPAGPLGGDVDGLRCSPRLAPGQRLRPRPGDACPGTWNHKSNPPRSVEVVHAEHRRYSVDDLQGYLLDAPTAPASSPLRAVPYIGPERPGDA